MLEICVWEFFDDIPTFTDASIVQNKIGLFEMRVDNKMSWVYFKTFISLFVAKFLHLLETISIILYIFYYFCTII
jgi:hypothetical protein